MKKNKKELRIKKGNNWFYLHTIDGKEDYYPVSKLFEQKNRIVSDKQLLNRLAKMCSEEYSSFNTVEECLTKPFKKGRPGVTKLGDFDELYSLWR